MRLLTKQEIDLLSQQGCTAEDWTAISVSEEFSPTYIRRVNFYGEVSLGVFEKSMEVGDGFSRHTGISDATLRNVSIGDNCLIDHIANHINNYTIGDDCLLVNIATMETTEGATFGEGSVVPVLNEAGEGNVMVYSGLTAQLVAFMVKYEYDHAFTSRLRRLIREEIDQLSPSGSVGNGVRIVNTQTITNCHIYDECEIDGACRLMDCTLRSKPTAPIYVGSGVVMENTVVHSGVSILNGSHLENCFVGEATQLKNGFTAENSIFIANCYMSQGEACAALCGPFSSSHHKSSLLIGVSTLFYNAGSATNFSNHAYKMGPIHHGTLERGVKTASGSHILMPTRVGQFSVCLGKLLHHADTRKLPFSYLVGSERGDRLMPGRNLYSVGLYRDTHKWAKRDLRAMHGRRSVVNFAWLSPFSVSRIVAGKQTLEDLQRLYGENVDTYTYQGFTIKASSLKKGIEAYDMAIRLFMGSVAKRHKDTPSTTTIGRGEWSDLMGMLLPLSEELRVVGGVKDGDIDSIDALVKELDTIHAHYDAYCWTWTEKLILDYYGADSLSQDVLLAVKDDYDAAEREWKAFIKADATREYELGDVAEDFLKTFLATLERDTLDI